MQCSLPETKESDDMKKNASVFLVLVLIVVALSGCDGDRTSVMGQGEAIYIQDVEGNKDTADVEVAQAIPSGEEQVKEPEETEEQAETTNQAESARPEEATQQSESAKSEEESVVADIESEEASSGKTAAVSEIAVNETVWANTNANLRSGPGTNYSIVGGLDYSESATRVAVTDNGWSKITYGEGTAYISSSLVQTTEVAVPDVFVASVPAPVTVAVAEEPVGTLCVGEAKVIFDEVNARRAEAGLEPLEWSDELASAADIRAGEVMGTFSHTRPDGTSWQTVSSLAAAENIVKGTRLNGYEMMELWMASEGHKANILYPTLRIIGVATRSTEAGDTGVQLFGW